MDTEVLSQILQMVGAAGEGASTLAIIYLLHPYVSTVSAIVIVWLVIKGVLRTISAFTFVRVVAGALKYSVRGEVANFERDEMIDRIRGLMETERRWKKDNEQ